MKKWKQGIIGLLVIFALLLIISCGDDKDDHTHDWGTWQSNETQHWQECTANDGAKTAPEAHTGNPCTVCGYETPHVQQPKTITQDSGLAFDGKVIIETDDLYLDADWNAVVAQVVAALNAAYEDTTMPVLWNLMFNGGEANDVVFGEGVQVVLKNNLATNWEVKKTLPDGGGVKGILHIKTSSINSITVASYDNALVSVAQNNSSISTY